MSDASPVLTQPTPPAHIDGIGFRSRAESDSIREGALTRAGEEKITNMPSSGSLIEIVAEATSMPTRTIATYYRVLREAGSIGQGGRGRNALKLTIGDATRLLVASLTSGDARDASAASDTIYAFNVASVVELPRNNARVIPSALSSSFAGDPAFGVDDNNRCFASIADDMMLFVSKILISNRHAHEAAAPYRIKKDIEIEEPFAEIQINSCFSEERSYPTSAILSYGRRGHGLIVNFSDRKSGRNNQQIIATRRMVKLPVLRYIVERISLE